MGRCRASKKSLSSPDDFEFFSFSSQDSISLFKNGQFRISFIVSKAFLNISVCLLSILKFLGKLSFI